MSPSVARSAEAPFQSRALMMRALLPSSSVNQSLTNILMCGAIAWVFGRRCGGSVTCSGFVKAFGSRNPSDIPLRPQARGVSGYNRRQRYYRAANPERIGETRPGPKGRVRVRNANASPHAT
jgi:hypothetical protein